MENRTRRDFIADSAKTTLAGSLLLFSAFNTIKTEKNIFVHHVFFWLKNQESQEDRENLVKGLKKLSTIPYIKLFHIGMPADTSRDVIDASYHISWLLIFNNAADQEKYQKDPVHLQFVEACSHLWSKVLVYDSVDA